MQRKCVTTFCVALESKVVYSAINRAWCTTPESPFDAHQTVVINILIVYVDLSEPNKA